MHTPASMMIAVAIESVEGYVAEVIGSSLEKCRPLLQDLTEGSVAQP
jgi:hypothetical protein